MNLVCEGSSKKEKLKSNEKIEILGNSRWLVDEIVETTRIIYSRILS